jgi:hypothetical protein
MGDAFVSLRKYQQETSRMDSSANDKAMEQPTSDSDSPTTDPDEPQAMSDADMVDDNGPVPNVQPEAASASQKETIPVSEDVIGHDVPIEPAPPGEPGMYWCDEADPGIHPILGEIQHGENDYTAVTHPDSLQAIGDLVAAGVLRKA